MNIKAVFYIKSPLQYLNAIEARSYYGYSDDESLLILHADRKNLAQLTQLVKRDSWGGMICLNGVGLRPEAEHTINLDARHPFFNNNIFSIAKLTFLAKKYSPVERVFIGDAGNPLMQHLINKVVCQEKVLLDDGLASRLYAEWRKAGWNGEEPRLKKRFNRRIKRLFFFLRDRLPSNLTFFSAYDLEISAPDRLIENKFNVLREGFAHTEQTDSIYFLGSSLVEAGIFTEKEYLQQLKKVDKYYGGGPVVYVAHRREPAERIAKITEELGWDTVLFKYPIECQLVVEGPRPRQLAAFVSSALENCHVIFGSALSIVSFRFDPASFSLVSPERGGRIWSLYDCYKAKEDETFKVVDL